MGSPLIELARVSRRFPTGSVPALTDIDLTIERGDWVAITGPSGSGKSTLLNIIGLLDRPSEGHYALDGRATESLPEVELDRLRATAIGFVFQASSVIGNRSVTENAALGLQIRGLARARRDELADKALSTVGLTTDTHRAAKLLSGGERQRLAIARTLASEPSLVLADEPTGNLDSANSARVMTLLTELHRRGHTIVLITHDPEVAAAARRQVVLSDGRVVKDHAREDLAPPPVTSVPEAANSTSSPQGLRTRLVDEMSDAMASIGVAWGRTLLLAVAFMLGVAGLVTSMGLSQSAAAQVSNRLTAAALDEVRVSPTSTSNAKSDEDIAADLHKIRGLPHVQGATATLTVAPDRVRASRLASSPAVDGIGLSATQGDFLDADLPLTPRHTRPLLTQPSNTPAAIIAEDAARALDVPFDANGVPPGTAVMVNDHRLAIVGVFRATERTALLRRSLVVSSTTLSQLAGRAELAYAVRTDIGHPSAVAGAVPLLLSPSDPGSYTVETVADLLQLRIGVADDLSLFVAVLSVIMLVLSSLSGATAMYLSVHMRSQEISLRRALGAGRASISRLFLAEGFLVGTAGGLLGGAVGMLATYAVAVTRGWHPVLPETAWIVGPAVGAIAGLCSSAYPAWLASRQDPALGMK